MAFTTWNASDKAAGITLSNANLTAASTSSANNAVRNVHGKRTGKWYVEINADAVSSSWYAGVVDGSASLLNISFVGTPLMSIVARGDGSIFTQNTNAFNIGSFSTNDKLCIAVDVDKKRIWMRKNSGNWNASASNDPTDYTTGYFCYNIQNFFLAFATGASALQATANFGDTAFSFTVPSGYTSGWDNVSTAAASYDYGAVATGKPALQPMKTSTVPAASMHGLKLNGVDYAYKLYTGPLKTLSGTVKENGVNVIRNVRAYNRLTGKIIGETTSASDGTFSINTAGYTNQCYVVALDDLTAGVDLNAQIFDLVIPL